MTDNIDADLAAFRDKFLAHTKATDNFGNLLEYEPLPVSERDHFCARLVVQEKHLSPSGGARLMLCVVAGLTVSSAAWRRAGNTRRLLHGLRVLSHNQRRARGALNC